MPHALALPSVGDVDESVGGLNDRGVAVFARFASSTSAGCQSWPSRETATLSGERPFGVWL